MGAMWRGPATRARRRSHARAAAVVVIVAASLLGFATRPATARAAELPIRIDSTVTLAQQFGYRPQYPLNVPSFDPANRPVVRSRTSSQHETRSAARLRDDGSWARSSLLKAVRRAYPAFHRTVNAGGYVSERIEFDRRGRAYTLLQIRLRGGARHNVLLYSLDGCRTWRLVTLPFGGKRRTYDGRDNGTAALEQYAGWNQGDRPPLVAVWRPVSDWKGSRASRNVLYVLRPRFRGSRLVLPRPALVSRWYIGQTYGAGGPSFAVSRGATAFVVWDEVSRAGDAGTPVYACSFNPKTGVRGRVRLVEAVPRNDDHDMPGIVRDGDGHLHVVSGAHNAQFHHARSLNPFDVSAWTAPEPMLDGGYLAGDGGPERAKQTYLSLACLPDDSLVAVYRQERRGVDEDFGGATYQALCCQVRPAEGQWGSPQRLVLCGNRAGYAIYHQKLTTDRLGNLYLSLSYFSPVDYPSAERAANRFRHRMVLTSKDGGASWDFATLDDYRAGIAAFAGVE